MFQSTFMIGIILWAQILLSQNKQAFSSDPFVGKGEMNGYSYKKFEGIEKKWKMVTVRFRKDTNEMRFTYANPKAWAALQNGVTNYPDGSIFAKIGVATADDPAFTSSAVPSGVRRFQLMVKDSKRHQETEGWGYALFDADGKTFPEDPKIKTMACAACHRAVPQRGYVFSQIMNLAQEKTSRKNLHGSLQDSLVGGTPIFKFETWPIQQLPQNIRMRLPKKIKEIRVLSGELRQNIFQGTLDEIRPTLTQESIRSGLPALLLSNDAKRYSIIFFAENTGACNSNELSMKAAHTIFETGQQYELEFCQPHKK